MINTRREFVKNMLAELIKKKQENVRVEETLAFIEDIMKCLENEEEEECKTNQQHVGIIELLRGHVALDWEGTNLHCKKCERLNKIIARKCVEFYAEYWKHRNVEFYDEEKQRDRLIKWHNKTKEEIDKGGEIQLKEHVKNNEIKIERFEKETLKR